MVKAFSKNFDNQKKFYYARQWSECLLLLILCGISMTPCTKAGHVKSGALWKNDRDRGVDLMCSVNSSKKSTSIFSEMKVAETVYLPNT